jgi:hypothetical protein
MGDELRSEDDKGMLPDKVVKRGVVDDGPGDDTEGHGRGRSAKEDQPRDEADGDKPGPDDVARFSDVNLKQAVVPVRW